MPEGPEVRRCAEQLSELILGKRVMEIRTVDGKLLRKHGRYLCNYKEDSGPFVDSVHTKGKAIFIKFGDHVLISTLGMSGWWYPKLHHPWYKDQKAYVKGKLVSAVDVIKSALTFAKLELVVEDQVAVYTDMRNFGNISLVSHDEAKAYEASIGLDLLCEVSDDVDLERALEVLKRAPAGALIGGTLLDQAILSGLGNIYRAETLYIARINPFKLIRDLVDDELERIIWAAVNVLNIAYHTRGMMLYPEVFLRSMLSNAVDKDVRGHLVYGRKEDIFGHKIIKDKSNGRTIWWVPQVQG